MAVICLSCGCTGDFGDVTCVPVRDLGCGGEKFPIDGQHQEKPSKGQFRWNPLPDFFC